MSVISEHLLSARLVSWSILLLLLLLLKNQIIDVERHEYHVLGIAVDVDAVVGLTLLES